MSEVAKSADWAGPMPAAGGALRGYAVWIAAALAFLVVPYVFSSGAGLTMLSLMGIMIVFTLSYNMLLGQTGMLSFGHAVYYGLGAFFAVHAMNAVIRAGLPVPVVAIPLVGGLAGLVFGIIFGSVSTRRGGTAFAMISLGLAELVASSANILRGFFGGEEGITTNRTKLLAGPRPEFRPAAPGLFPDRRLVRRLHDRDVRDHPHAARAHVQRGAREPGAGPVRRLQSADGALHRLLAFRLLRRHRRRRSRRSTSRSSTRAMSGSANPASCCSPPISAASATSSGR